MSFLFNFPSHCLSVCLLLGMTKMHAFVYKFQHIHIRRMIVTTKHSASLFAPFKRMKTNGECEKKKKYNNKINEKHLAIHDRSHGRIYRRSTDGGGSNGGGFMCIASVQCRPLHRRNVNIGQFSMLNAHALFMCAEWEAPIIPKRELYRLLSYTMQFGHRHRNKRWSADVQTSWRHRRVRAFIQQIKIATRISMACECVWRRRWYWPRPCHYTHRHRHKMRARGKCNCRLSVCVCV